MAAVPQTREYAANMILLGDDEILGDGERGLVVSSSVGRIVAMVVDEGDT